MKCEHFKIPLMKLCRESDIGQVPQTLKLEPFQFHAETLSKDSDITVNKRQ